MLRYDYSESYSVTSYHAGKCPLMYMAWIQHYLLLVEAQYSSVDVPPNEKELYYSDYDSSNSVVSMV